jgi:hypothetical protein
MSLSLMPLYGIDQNLHYVIIFCPLHHALATTLQMRSMAHTLGKRGLGWTIVEVAMMFWFHR